MDAANAAAQSDPDRNPHFRRRWYEPRVVAVQEPAPRDQMGTLGQVLLAAFRRREAEGLKPVAHDGSPPQ